MKAVNLLPADARHAGEVRLRGANPGTLALLGVLVLGVLVVASYVVLSNRVSSKQSELAQVNAQVQVAQQQAAKLKRFADLIAKRDAAVQQVTTLADARYDWATVLSRMARALPANTSLTTFSAALGGSTSTSTPTPTPGTSSSGGPTISINGCTDSHSAAGRVMERLRAIKGVTDVSLQSSTIKATAGSTGTSSNCGNETFALTVSLKPTAAASTASTTTASPATGTTTAPTTTTPTASAPSSGGTS